MNQVWLGVYYETCITMVNYLKALARLTEIYVIEDQNMTCTKIGAHENADKKRVTIV